MIGYSNLHNAVQPECKLMYCLLSLGFCMSVFHYVIVIAKQCTVVMIKHLYFSHIQSDSYFPIEVDSLQTKNASEKKQPTGEQYTGV